MAVLPNNVSVVLKDQRLVWSDFSPGLIDYRTAAHLHLLVNLVVHGWFRRWWYYRLLHGENLSW